MSEKASDHFDQKRQIMKNTCFSVRKLDFFIRLLNSSKWKGVVNDLKVVKDRNVYGPVFTKIEKGIEKKEE